MKALLLVIAILLTSQIPTSAADCPNGQCRVERSRSVERSGLLRAKVVRRVIVRR